MPKKTVTPEETLGADVRQSTIQGAIAENTQTTAPTPTASSTAQTSAPTPTVPPAAEESLPPSSPEQEPILVLTEKRFRLFSKGATEDWFILNDRNQLIQTGTKLEDGKRMVKRFGFR